MVERQQHMLQDPNGGIFITDEVQDPLGLGEKHMEDRRVEVAHLNDEPLAPYCNFRRPFIQPINLDLAHPNKISMVILWRRLFLMAR